MEKKILLQGNLSGISLSDVMQLLNGSSSTGVLFISSPSCPVPGQIFFLNGELIHGTCGQRHGLEAVYTLFGWTIADFKFIKEPIDHVIRTINQSLIQVVLDAMRLLDEGKIRKLTAPADSRETKSPDLSPKTLPVIKGPGVNFADVINEEKFQDGQEIVTEGGHGGWIWVIMDGKVKVSKQTPRGPMAVAVLGEGNFIGSIMSLLHKKITRTATVTALGDVRLGVLDIQNLAKEYSSLSLDFRMILLSMAGRLAQITNRAVNLSAGNKSNHENMHSKKTILKKGSAIEEVYIITEGESYVVGQTPLGLLTLLTLRKMDVFGQLPFLNLGLEPLVAAVLASDDLKAYRPDTSTLHKEYNGMSDTFRNLISNVGNCVNSTSRLACNFAPPSTLTHQ
jgi:CRP-like cAMP-binding protein